MYFFVSKLEQNDRRPFHILFNKAPLLATVVEWLYEESTEGGKTEEGPGISSVPGSEG